MSIVLQLITRFAIVPVWFLGAFTKMAEKGLWSMLIPMSVLSFLAVPMAVTTGFL